MHMCCIPIGPIGCPCTQVAADHGFDYLNDQNVPMLVRGVYGKRIPRLVVMLRDPIDRLHSAYYG